jgi:hypothetical protein
MKPMTIGNFGKGIVLAALTVGGLAFAFSPELHNEDDKTYEMEIECGGSTTHTSLGGHTTTSLSGDSGCKLKVKGAGVVKLADDMKCKIQHGELDCT